MQKTIQNRNSNQDLFVYPSNGKEILTNPPYFSWPLQNNSEKITFELRNKNKKLIHQENTNSNLIECQSPLKKGIYYWNIFQNKKLIGDYSFEVGENSLLFDTIKLDEIFDKIPLEFPKHYWGKDCQIKLLKNNQKTLQLLRNNVKLAIDEGIPPKPMYHLISDKTQRSRQTTIYFKRFRQYCDRNLVASAFAWYLWKDEKAKNVVKDFYLEVCTWNTEGVCAVDGPYGDEIGLSLARCFAIVYDLTHDIWDQQQKLWIQNTLYLYGKQIYRRLLNTNFLQKPGNSHVGRLPGYLGDYAIILKGIAPEAEVKAWLSYALKCFHTIYPFYGEEDGGWSQGSFYASTYLKWHAPFFMAIEKYTNKSFYEKPFFRNYIHYLVHFLNPLHELHPFGDGFWTYDIKKEWPGFFAENPTRIYQEKFGNQQSQKIANLAPKRKLMELHIFDEMVPSQNLKKSKNAVKKINTDHCFSETGLISMNSNLMKPSNNNALYIRCSKFGAGSHQHADQGNFAILSQGKAMINPSGFFGHHYGDTHHTDWTQTTKAHNLFLINQTGQKYNSPQTYGSIKRFITDKGFGHTFLDISSAYPLAKLATRSITFIKPGLILLIDNIQLNKKESVQWLLHSLKAPKVTKNDLSIKRNHLKITGEFIKIEEEPLSVKMTNQFDFNKPFSASLSQQKRIQFHCQWEFPQSNSHHIAMLFTINNDKNKYEAKDQKIIFHKNKIILDLKTGELEYLKK